MATGAETASHTTVRSKKGWALVLAYCPGTVLQPRLTLNHRDLPVFVY